MAMFRRNRGASKVRRGATPGRRGERRAGERVAANRAFIVRSDPITMRPVAAPIRGEAATKE